MIYFFLLGILVGIAISIFCVFVKDTPSFSSLVFIREHIAQLHKKMDDTIALISPKKK